MNAAAGPNLKSVLRALHGTNITLFYQDADLRYVWLENPPQGWLESEIIGKTDHDILSEAAAEILIPAKQEVLRTGVQCRVVAPVEAHGTTRWYENSIEVDRNKDGEIVGLLFFILDVTDKIRSEENLRQLLLEVSHRSRNLLAIVQSIAGQSLRSPDNEAGLNRFNERLQSLALTLGVVTDGNWDGATLHDLVAKQTAPFSIDGRTPEVEGVNPLLTPNAAVHIGLAVQELASAIKHKDGNGFSVENVRVSAAFTEEKNADFIFQWREKVTSGDVPAILKQMNTLTLCDVVPKALSGSAKVEHWGDAVVYALTVPAENFE